MRVIYGVIMRFLALDIMADSALYLAWVCIYIGETLKGQTNLSHHIATLLLRRKRSKITRLNQAISRDRECVGDEPDHEALGD